MKKLAKAMVVPVRQRTQYTCVPCSLSMCLRALGLDWITEDIVNDVMGARPMKGATWEQVLAATQHFGKRGTLTSPCTVEQLKEWTDQGIPVMIAYNPEGRDWSHASVVFHVDSEKVYVADPNIPDPSEFVREFSWKEFYGVWYEKWPNYLVRRPAMAISHEISEAGQQVPPPNLRVAMKKKAGSDYMSKQNIRDSLRMCKDLVLWVDGENMEDWVEDKLSVIRAALSDVHRFYENGHWDIGKQKITLWKEASAERVASMYLANSIDIWLDDIRDPTAPQFDMTTKYRATGREVWIKTVPEAIKFLEKNKGRVRSISFDHDLGVGQIDGIELAKWLEEKAYFNEYPPVQWKVHSDNPVGARNIERAMASADRYWKRR